MFSLNTNTGYFKRYLLSSSVHHKFYVISGSSDDVLLRFIGPDCLQESLYLLLVLIVMWRLLHPSYLAETDIPRKEPEEERYSSAASQLPFPTLKLVAFPLEKVVNPKFTSKVHTFMRVRAIPFSPPLWCTWWPGRRWLLTLPTRGQGPLLQPLSWPVSPGGSSPPRPSR